ncbi:nucleotidyltransferase domain-containing protein [Sinorhizobium medicae]|nr:nucleotidyltransferase domain-containing protein [Sinorhizobium medicae]
MQTKRRQMAATALDTLRGSDSTRWSNIAGAKVLSDQKRTELNNLAGDLLTTDEGTLIIFGSLARDEYTAGSDLDWTVLIDGRADSRHFEVVRQVKERLEGRFGKPGPAEVFGSLVFSHDLVHLIGGDDDTNKNMKRRLLLLLESTPIGSSTSRQVHERIVNVVLNRYVEEDASFIRGNRRSDRIPRFLLNDVVRFWRTIAVDYANKYRARGGDKWALRNIKLRMSRKLIFTSGLLMCITWALREADGSHDALFAPKIVTHLTEWTRRPPLESLAMVIHRHAPELADEVFDNYDAFLALLNDQEQRGHLEKLSPEDAYADADFLAARDRAIKFDQALTKLLFEADPGISSLVKKYGVF